MKHAPMRTHTLNSFATASLALLALAPAALAQNVGAGAGTRESREAIQNTGASQAPPAAPATGISAPPSSDATGTNQPPLATAPPQRFKIAGGFVQQFDTSLNTGGNYAAAAHMAPSAAARS
jgi:hypothetical protein